MNELVILSVAKDLLARVERRKMILRFAQDDTVPAGINEHKQWFNGRFEGIFMPKMKTHRGAAKRFKKTGTGKVVRSQAFHSHILTKKSSGRKSRLAGEVEVSSANTYTVNRMLPYK